jgi:hypothetical protein
MFVSAGLQKLPGASGLDNPSMITTRITSKEDKMPRTDVYDSRDKGRNTVGTNLKYVRSGVKSKLQEATYNMIPQSLYVVVE